jgi:hypothetical protein
MRSQLTKRASIPTLICGTNYMNVRKSLSSKIYEARDGRAVTSNTGNCPTLVVLKESEVVLICRHRKQQGKVALLHNRALTELARQEFLRS